MQPSFESLSLSDALIAVVGELGYTQPTPIQAAAIPALLAGRDVVGQSQTGSGKTAAFALPILQRVDIDNRSVQALVLCPTRELTAQVAREVRTLGRAHNGLKVLELVGGQPGKPQREALERGVHIVIGTPGRLLDHLGRGSLDPGSIMTLVLDEADRMLDMGFGDEVQGIVREMPSSRQTALFSATFPVAIEEMIESFQRDALRVTIETPAESVLDIRQLRLCVDRKHKLEALCWLLATHPHESALVFCNQKSVVAQITNTLDAAGVSVDRLDGDLEQFHRDQVLARFRNQSVRVLVATDVAGRGLDVEDLDLVINFEMPLQPEIYVHRIGRTGRAGKKGVAISITTSEPDLSIEAIEELTGNAIEVLSSETLSHSSLPVLLKSIAGEPRMETILISGGRKDKVRKGDILGALTGDAGGLRGADIGKIEIQDRLSYVAVSRRAIGDAVKSLNKGRIKGKRFRATHVGGDGKR
ncbi:MAG: ATP-independent RNA helicase DbpA [Planctomycetota bacterium]